MRGSVHCMLPTTYLFYAPTLQLVVHCFSKHFKFYLFFLVIFLSSLFRWTNSLYIIFRYARIIVLPYTLIHRRSLFMKNLFNKHEKRSSVPNIYVYYIHGHIYRCNAVARRTWGVLKYYFFERKTNYSIQIQSILGKSINYSYIF